MDDTLPDDAWKDSFDKLLSPRPQLRELNIIKKNVRVSFNIDSSVENSNPDILSVSECSMPKANLLNVGDRFNIKRKSGSSISTPCEKRLSSNLFYCALSPITSMKLDGIQIDVNQKVSDIGKEQPRAIKHVCFEINGLDDSYAAAKMLNTCKIGEGVYGEVFKYIPKISSESNVVLKVIPIEGSELVNGEVQKTFEQILPEIIISQELSNLRVNPTNSTSGFVNIYNVALVKGKYPQHLLKLWEEYDEKKESENDHPEMFTDRQLFIVLELNFAGSDMSTFTFLNAEQSYYALQQVIVTLAVGEEAFEFEHRDLHWGNILVEETKTKQIDYKLNGKEMSLATKGVRVTIIDYTLSRVTVGECCHYNDLSTDEELFAASGDYQYDIYRLMRDELKNNWSAYAPKTNVMWLSKTLVNRKT
ncbi:hypothetical protein ACLKA7_001997 [Drosophila subpalustris]